MDQTTTVAQFRTELGHGQSVKFAPLDETGNRLAVATGSEYGLSGDGHLYVLERNEEIGRIDEILNIDYRDNIFDVCWSEVDPNILAIAGGDGFVQVYNIGGKFPRVPISELKGHKKEMSSVDWCLPKFNQQILAANWDGTVSTYDIRTGSPWPIQKCTLSSLLCYQAVWSPHSPNIFIGVSSDGGLQMWDLNVSKDKPQVSIGASTNELLCCDWAKYDQNMIASGGGDSIIRGWDLRNYTLPIFMFEEHGQAVKRIKFSPFLPTTIASVSYDFTTRIWDYQLADVNVETINNHNEFIYGLDWSLRIKGELATCAWDKTVKISRPICLRGT